MATNILISIFQNRPRDQNLKKKSLPSQPKSTFLKEFFNEMWLNVREHK